MGPGHKINENIKDCCSRFFSNQPEKRTYMYINREFGRERVKRNVNRVGQQRSRTDRQVRWL